MSSHKPEEKRLFLELKNVTFSKKQNLLFKNINWRMHIDENWAIIGASGSGKSTFAEAVAGQLSTLEGKINYYFIPDCNLIEARKQIAYVSFAERSAYVDYSKHYYQQRFNATEADDCITVRQYLSLSSLEEKERINQLFQLDELLDRSFIKLSNGQTRKVRIVKAILKNPSLLILDDPFMGLDETSREVLKNTIDKLSFTGTKIILITTPRDIPSCITDILELENLAIKGIYNKDLFLKT